MNDKQNRPKISSLGYALLSLVARRDWSGYEIAQFLKPPKDHIVWPARHSQIYPELAKLTEAGLVTFMTVEQHQRPDKKLYRITDEGRRHLKEWLDEPPRPATDRREILIKSYSTWISDHAVAREMYRKEAEEAEADVVAIENDYEKLVKKLGMRGPGTPDMLYFGSFANIKYTLAQRKAYGEWCRWMEEQLTQAIENDGDEAEGGSSGHRPASAGY